MSERRYTHGHHESVLRSHRWRTAENSCGYLLAHLRPGMTVVDVGCGPGTITCDLAERVAPGRVVGVDASEEVLDIAQSEASRRGVDVDFVVGDAYRLDLPDDSVDLVHAHQVLQHLGDPVGALVEWGRVCRPGGLVAARDADYSAKVTYPDPGGVLARWLALVIAAGRANGGEPDAGRRLVAWAREAGFEDVAPSASAWCYATPEDRSWWGGLWAERMTASAVVNQALDEGLASPEDLAEMAEAWRAWAADPSGSTIVPAGEILCRAPAGSPRRRDR